jgi:hypothetical protein
MKTINIEVEITLATAMARGYSQYGRTTVTLSDADVAGMSDGARALLVQATKHESLLSVCGRALSVDRADEPTVCAAIEAMAAEKGSAQAEQEREEAARNEAEVQRVLALEPRDWLMETDGGSVRASGWYLWVDDPRIDARREEICRDYLPAYRAELVEARRVSEARDAEAKRVMEARETAYLGAIRDVGSRYDDLARAVAENYNIEAAVLNHLTADLQARLDGVNSEVDTREFDDPQDRSAPSAESFAMLDRVTAAVRGENERLPVALGRWVVSRIVRVKCQAGHNVTAVLATLDTLHSVREVLFSLESLEEREDDE